MLINNEGYWVSDYNKPWHEPPKNYKFSYGTDGRGITGADRAFYKRTKKKDSGGDKGDGSGGGKKPSSSGGGGLSSGFADSLAKAGKGNLDYTSDWYKYLINKTKSKYDPLVDRYTQELAGLEPEATANAKYGTDFAKKALGGWYPEVYDTWMNDVIQNARDQSMRDMEYNQRQQIGGVLNNLAGRGALSSSVNVDAQRQIGESANRNLADLSNKLGQWKGNTQIGLPKQMQAMGQSFAQNAPNTMRPNMMALGSTLEARGDLLNHIGAGQGLIDAARTYPSMMDPYLKDVSYAQQAFNLANAPLMLQNNLMNSALAPLMSGGSGGGVNMPAYGSSGIFNSGLANSISNLFPSNTTQNTGFNTDLSNANWGNWNLF